MYIYMCVCVCVCVYTHTVFLLRIVTDFYQGQTSSNVSILFLLDYDRL